MEKVHIDYSDSEPWIEQELDLPKTLMAFKIPIDTISGELDRSLTATSLKALELGFNSVLMGLAIL